MKLRNAISTAVVAALLLHAPAALACAACYGKSDSALAQGMNWGIFTLLGVVGFVLVGVAGFFVFIIRRAARLATVPQTSTLPTNL
jgi:heme/copper-type cytochrome/quinol oxidase subunit 2